MKGTPTMTRGVKNLLSFALAGVIGVVAAGSLSAQGTSTGTSMTGGSTSSAGSFGLNSSSFGLSSAGTTGGTTSTGVYGQSAGAGSKSTGVGSTSLFGLYYANPLSLGVPGSSSTTSSTTGGATPTFAQPLFNISSGTSSIYSSTGSTSGSSTGRGSTGRAGSSSSTGTIGNRTSTSSSTTFSPVTTYRSSPSFVTRVSFAGGQATPPARTEVLAGLQRLIADSPEITSRAGISVRMDGDKIVLSGQVLNNSERRLVESMMLLSPGVRSVQNELVPTVTTED
jgi:hypothetical protein